MMEGRKSCCGGNSPPPPREQRSPALFAVNALAADKPTMGIVVKIGGIPWFNAMETGIKENAAKLGVDATMIGPTSADPALQVRAIEDLIAKNVDRHRRRAERREGARAGAREGAQCRHQGRLHEGPGIQNKDWDFELASAKGFGETHAEMLAQKMGGKGEYAVFVGSLTVPLHNAWADAAIAYLKAKYPDMKLVGDRYGVAESVDDSRKTALDVMAAHPEPEGLPCLRQPGSDRRRPGDRRAPYGGKVFVFGPFSPGQGNKLVKEGAICGRLHVESRAKPAASS